MDRHFDDVGVTRRPRRSQRPARPFDGRLIALTLGSSRVSSLAMNGVASRLALSAITTRQSFGTFSDRYACCRRIDASRIVRSL
jgi:hypothetical protein